MRLVLNSRSTCLCFPYTGIKGVHLAPWVFLKQTPFQIHFFPYHSRNQTQIGSVFTLSHLSFCLYTSSKLGIMLSLNSIQNPLNNFDSKSGIVVHTCNLSYLRKLRQKDQEFETKTLSIKQNTFPPPQTVSLHSPGCP